MYENNQEAAVRIDVDGEISFDWMDESKRQSKKGEIGHNSPHVSKTFLVKDLDG